MRRASSLPESRSSGHLYATTACQVTPTSSKRVGKRARTEEGRTDDEEVVPLWLCEYQFRHLIRRDVLDLLVPSLRLWHAQLRVGRVMTAEELVEWGEDGSEAGQGERCQCVLLCVVCMYGTEYN